ncbi:hypothetical protein GCM10010289_72520 [Streptomyces violascens]|nr:hypothetical protein GCM10010289_72520 [Streptomyces violascens]
MVWPGTWAPRQPTGSEAGFTPGCPQYGQGGAGGMGRGNIAGGSTGPCRYWACSGRTHGEAGQFRLTDTRRRRTIRSVYAHPELSWTDYEHRPVKSPLTRPGHAQHHRAG